MLLPRRDFLLGVLALPGLRAPRGRKVVVRDGIELRVALRTAEPGTVIVLAPGDYGDGALLDLATPDVTLRAASPLCARLRAPLHVRGDRAKLLGLAFRGDGDDNIYLSAVAACRDSLMITAVDVEVRGCDFGFFPKRAILVRPSGLRPYIHDCSFHDNRDGGGDINVHEAISLGYDNPSSGTPLKARIVRNRMWNLNIEGEAISVKTSDNLIQGNEISNSRAGFTNRYGERSCFADNVFTNTRGIAISGRGCRLLNNRINGRGSIAVQGGNASPDVTRNGVHPQSMNTYLEGNSGPLVIGGQIKPLPAVNTTVRGHKGSIRLLNENGTKIGA